MNEAVWGLIGAVLTFLANSWQQRKVREHELATMKSMQAHSREDRRDEAQLAETRLRHEVSRNAARELIAWLARTQGQRHHSDYAANAVLIESIGDHATRQVLRLTLFVLPMHDAGGSFGRLPTACLDLARECLGAILRGETLPDVARGIDSIELALTEIADHPSADFLRVVAAPLFDLRRTPEAGGA
ncbi:MAG: hypothetical protein H6722_30680 [Sandaracinus sp.]|nr:hypothetical protein [Myxococcales bacterium]MCB9599546.1 hypothetical protein [Sandaracinus sp.]MCB9616822.1 hypothetical protein [Sandaracinus sp.]